MGVPSHSFREVPPPCPVDDTPFTACTPTSVARQHAHHHQQVVVVGLAEPQQVIVLRPDEQPPTVQPPTVQPISEKPQPPPFTTANYKRKTHSRRGGA
jgi:hypothetical protein